MSFTCGDAQGRTGGGTIGLVVNCSVPPHPTTGPDVYTYAITDVPRWGTNTAGDVTAYSVGTTSSNSGDYPVLWIDAATIRDLSTFEQPAQYSVGVKYVLVNGKTVISDGKITAERPGRALRGPGYRGR